MEIDTQYCDNCGLLHDTNDGDCLGCKLTEENQTLKAAFRKLDEAQIEGVDEHTARISDDPCVVKARGLMK